jgi:hypothetical protein
VKPLIEVSTDCASAIASRDQMIASENSAIVPTNLRVRMCICGPVALTIWSARFRQAQHHVIDCDH